MGTRGAYGFISNNKEKVTYNHYDSYPSALGEIMIKFINETDNKAIKSMFDKIKLVNQDDKPTPKQIGKYAEIADLNVSDKSVDDWYCLLRNTQGLLSVYKNGVEHMIDSHTFLKDSLFCEWAYIINVDTMELEVYKGFNQNRSALGRYADTKPDNEYYGVELIDTVPLDKIRKLNELELTALVNNWDKQEEED